MANIPSSSGDRGPAFEGEYTGEGASGSFFHADFKRHDDLKMMLDSNRDNLKLEAMKRIIGMIAKGRDASGLFPAVVKNVVSKNLEIKKLVYVYLERYAEEQQDLALLSISTFQRALKEPNPLIRAGALRVLSSIRVKMIAPIVMIAITDASSDMSPYVRKTAAHAIPKLYGLDPELKDELVLVIQKLLGDRTVLVIGSAAMAFTEVCPERIDLIHAVYRKLCSVLIDVDEWGQVTIVNMLTRYARMQFGDPNRDVPHENESDDDSPSGTSAIKIGPTLDPDHRLLLRSTKPLLQSRNAAVVMAVAQLYHHAAPKSDSLWTAKALIRLLRSHPEVQTVVLNTIASISAQNKQTFEPYLRTFFVRTSDATSIKLLKLEILTNLVSEANISSVLRELQTYITHPDKEFVSATIQAIGRCACSISEITDSCLNGLVTLLSDKDEAVVAESVVVIKRLLQTQAADPQEIITHMAKLLDNITVAQARAAILWLVGEHSHKVPLIAPDVLRKLCKTFADEDEIVKMQVMNLAVKLCISNPKQTEKLCHYVLKLARYDVSYDIRDKARFMKQCLMVVDSGFAEYAEEIFLCSKPAPMLKNRIEDDYFQLGSLSHFLKTSATGYEPLPPFPANPPPGDARNVEPIPGQTEAAHFNKNDSGKDLFSWGNDTNSVQRSANSSSSDEESSSSGSESEDQESDADSSSSLPSSKKGEAAPKKVKPSTTTESSSEESSSEEEDDDEEDDDDEEEEQPAPVKLRTEPQSRKHSQTKPESKQPPPEPKKSNLDLLLDLNDDDIAGSGSVLMPSAPLGMLTPSASGTSSQQTASIEEIQPIFVHTKSNELLDRFSGRGLSITYRYTRMQNVFQPTMTNINLMFTNHNTDEITNIKIGKKHSNVKIQEFVPLAKLLANCTLSAPLDVDFGDSTKPFKFEIDCSLGTFTVSIRPSIGELIKPVTMPEKLFVERQAKLQGMNERTKVISKGSIDYHKKISEFFNLGVVLSEDKDCLRYAGKTMSESSLVLVSVTKTKLTVNCENPVFGDILYNELIKSLDA